jgi:ribosomal protein S18 acetylase RimI-like enzyme
VSRTVEEAHRVRIRTATTADADAIAALHTESWRATYPGMMPAAFLDGPVVDDHHRLWAMRVAPEGTDAGGRPYVAVADDAGEIVGFECLIDEAPHEVLLDNLHVRPGRTGSGIGRSLLSHAFAWVAADRPGCRISLWVLADNAGAIQFYERHGGLRERRRLERFEAGFEVETVEYVWPAESLLGRGVQS